MKIAITGATGLVGKSLCLRLFKENHDLVIFTRNVKKTKILFDFPCQIIEWNPISGTPPKGSLQGVESIINLMGENIANKRWSLAQKKKILESRTLGTKNLAQGILQDQVNLQSFISASAIGIYTKNSLEILSEHSSPAHDFLSEVCKQWEESAQKIPTKRHVIFRIGVILSHEGGALAKLLPLFKAGVGGPVGNGKQWMSWIHRDDLVNLLAHAATDSTFQGIYNAVAPQTVTNKEFSQSLALQLKRPALFPAPKIMLQLAFGEMSSIILDSQKVTPKRLIEKNHTFLYPDLTQAFKQIAPQKSVPSNDKLLACEQLHFSQWLKKPIAELFSFFSDPSNLEKITPSSLSFKILKVSTQNIQSGTEIFYKLKIKGIPVQWKTVITQWDPPSRFSDIQEKGPYQIWDHSHRFTSCHQGTLMEDEIFFQVPGGIIGQLLLLPWIKKDIQKIFQYRKEVLKKQFA